MALSKFKIFRCILEAKKSERESFSKFSPPHDLAHKIGEFHIGNDEHARMAIDAALAAKESWESMPWEQRAAIFPKSS